MRIKKINKIIIVIVVTAVVLAGVTLFVSWDRTFPIKSVVDPLQSQRYQIDFFMRDYAEPKLYGGISLTEQSDSEENPYYVGKIDPELDILLVSLVDAYNADPQNAKFISLQEVRYNLTEGIAKATAKGNEDSGFTSFLRWCKEPANLVWKGDVYSGDVLVGSKSEAVNQENIINHKFIFNREDPSSSDFKYPWE